MTRTEEATANLHQAIRNWLKAKDKADEARNKVIQKRSRRNEAEFWKADGERTDAETNKQYRLRQLEGAIATEQAD